MPMGIKRNGDDGYQHDLDVLLDERDVPQEVAQQRHPGCPEDSANRRCT